MFSSLLRDHRARRQLGSVFVGFRNRIAIQKRNVDLLKPIYNQSKESLLVVR